MLQENVRFSVSLGRTHPYLGEDERFSESPEKGLSQKLLVVLTRNRRSIKHGAVGVHAVRTSSVLPVPGNPPSLDLRKQNFKLDIFHLFGTVPGEKNAFSLHFSKFSFPGHSW